MVVTFDDDVEAINTKSIVRDYVTFYHRIQYALTIDEFMHYQQLVQKSIFPPPPLMILHIIALELHH